MKWVQHVDFEKEFVANIITIEGYTFDESDVSNEGDFSFEHIPAVADRKGTVNGQIELADIGGDYRLSESF